MTQTQLEEAFNKAYNSDLTLKTDLTNILSGSNEKFAKNAFFSTPSMSGVESGMITFNSSYLDEVIADSDNNLELFNNIAGIHQDKQALAIWTTNYVAYSMQSNLGFKLESGDKYYKISVDVFTQNISVKDNSTDEIGAGIKLSGFDNTFTNIQSNNAWTTYTFYVKVDSETTTNIEFSLGDESNKTKGFVAFTNIKFDSSITAEEYNSAVDSNIVKIVKVAEVADDSTTDDSTTETDGTSSKSSKTNWIFLIPSLLTVLAILIAIVGFIIRKIKWKKPVKKSKTSYDRNKTVSVQYYTRKATTMREEKVRELTADLEKVNAERKQFEDQYKQDLSKLRELKLKRASAQEIAKLEKDMKKNQKLSSTLGVTANKISNELEYSKSNIYLNALIKKLSREPSQKEDEKNEE